MRAGFEKYLFDSGESDWSDVRENLGGSEDALIVSPRESLRVENGKHSAFLEEGGYWGGRPERINGEEYLIIDASDFDSYIEGPVSPEDYRANFVFGAKDGYTEELKVVPTPDRDYPEQSHSHPNASETYFVMGEAVLEMPDDVYDISNSYFEVDPGISHRLLDVGAETSLVITRSADKANITKIDDSEGQIYEIGLDPVINR